MLSIKLKSITIKGFKSIKNIESFAPQSLNILIGPNGAGKSNFISFFKFLSQMLNSDGKLQEYVAFLGGANDILHDGVERTKDVEGHIKIETPQGVGEYAFKLMFAKPDKLVFREEKYRFMEPVQKEEVKEWIMFGVGHEEAQLPSCSDPIAISITNLLKELIVYQFHNTTDSSPMRLKWSIADARWLRKNGENLGSFLLRIQKDDHPYYVRIVRYLRSILPFFDDFELYEEFGKVLLRWKEKGSNQVFNAGQASDGMLRTIALISLLSQNPKDLPSVLFLDEPELGLHPSAIDVVAGMLKIASSHCQVFAATQSISLVNHFEPEQLVVIERVDRGTELRRPENENLKAYLDEYSTAEIWEKNIIGGRP